MEAWRAEALQRLRFYLILGRNVATGIISTVNQRDSQGVVDRQNGAQKDSI